MSFSLPLRGDLLILLPLIIIAAIYDLRYRRIPNWLTLSGVVAGLAMNAVLDPIWPGIAFSLKGLGIGFGVYFLLYAIRAMGAGDVKLMAAVGAVVGWQNWFAIFIVTAVLGGVLAIIFSLLKGRLTTTFWNVGFILSEMKHGRPAYLGMRRAFSLFTSSSSLPR